MGRKTYFLVCATVFCVVAVAHLIRLITGWEIILDGWHVPHWVSVPGLIIPGALSVWGFVLAFRTGVRSP